jgi:CheY-like chemotaxis protein
MAAKKILIADDSRTFRHLEQELLTRRGYSLLQAANGAQAIQIASRENPDLILLDLQMPVMDGARALAVLKSNDNTSAIPVVMITTISDPVQREQLLKAGAVDFIAKPIAGADLLKLVRELIGDAA